MKKQIYRLLGRLGYRIENKRKELASIEAELSRYSAVQNRELLIRAHNYIRNIQNLFPDLTIADEGSGVIVNFDGNTFYLESAEEFFIINEVFIEGDYKFISNKHTIAIDIGANIGISSVFFSSIPHITKIYAFEPVTDTFEQARRNFKLNNLDQKIDLRNVGLGRGNRSETFIFNKFIKGNTGLRGTLSQSYSKAFNYEERVVTISDASIVFSEISNANPYQKIIVKVDCEGAEYEIFEKLNETDTLRIADVYLIEWHDKGAGTLEQILSNNGYFVVSRRLTENSGMIYAIKN